MSSAAIAISAIFGPYLLIQGLWMLVQRKNCLKICDSIRKTPAAIFCVGWTSLLIGLYLVNQFNMWQWNAMFFVTLLGWVYVVRALVVMFIPQLYLKAETHETAWITTMGVVRLAWGFALCWIAFWM